MLQRLSCVPLAYTPIQARDWTCLKRIAITHPGGNLQNLLFVTVYRAETCIASCVNPPDYYVSADSGEN